MKSGTAFSVAPLSPLRVPSLLPFPPEGEIREFFSGGRPVQSSLNEGFCLTFILTAGTADTPPEALMLFVNAPNGREVTEAQVVFTLLGPGNEGLLARAVPQNGGYAVPLPRREPGVCLVETEVITDGQMLTEHFFFVRRPEG